MRQLTKIKMADVEGRMNRMDQAKKTTKFKGKLKAHWRKPHNLPNMGNKEKGHAFVEKRKRIALKEYKKLLKKTREQHKLREVSDDKAEPDVRVEGRVSDTTTSQQDKLSNQRSLESSSRGVRKQHHQSKQKPVNRLTAAESEFKKRKLEKEKLIKEREIVKQKHREEVREKMKKRRETFGRLNRKTRKGQPVMANQIEHLLEKIQAQS